MTGRGKVGALPVLDVVVVFPLSSTHQRYLIYIATTVLFVCLFTSTLGQDRQCKL
jgi:hypothetical protein